jgi:hypothetical protein
MLERDNDEEDLPEVLVSYTRERASGGVDFKAMLNNYPTVFLRVPASRGSYQPSSNPPSPQAKGTPPVALSNLETDPGGTVRMGSEYPSWGTHRVEDSPPKTYTGHKKFIQRIT